MGKISAKSHFQKVTKSLFLPRFPKFSGNLNYPPGGGYGRNIFYPWVKINNRITDGPSYLGIFGQMGITCAYLMAIILSKAYIFSQLEISKGIR